jgi:hypothetical protein
MALATQAKPARRLPTTQSADPTTPMTGEDGYPVRLEEVDGDLVPFSLKPFPESERPLYWNPIYPGQEMRWRSREKNEFGFQPTIQREKWLDGQYRPRNAWEVHMTREFLKRLPGGDPDGWQGVNHPDGPDAEWRCQCTWHTGNYKAYMAHRRYLRHQEAMDF